MSNNKYNNRLAVLKVDKAIHDPKTKADKRTANQFLHFAQWCELRGRFTSNQMYTELKRIMVLNYMAYKNEQMLFEILSDNFNLEVKRNRKTNLIICRQRGVV